MGVLRTTYPVRIMHVGVSIYIERESYVCSLWIYYVLHIHNRAVASPTGGVCIYVCVYVCIAVYILYRHFYQTWRELVKVYKPVRGQPNWYNQTLPVCARFFFLAIQARPSHPASVRSFSTPKLYYTLI